MAGVVVVVWGMVVLGGIHSKFWQSSCGSNRIMPQLAGHTKTNKINCIYKKGNCNFWTLLNLKTLLFKYKVKFSWVNLMHIAATNLILFLTWICTSTVVVDWAFFIIKCSLVAALHDEKLDLLAWDLKKIKREHFII